MEAMMRSNHIFKTLILAVFVAGALAGCGEQKSYDQGVSDDEIKIGSTNPYSGPASAYGTIGRAETAYFDMINEQGGINGRKINFISLDDGYSPPRTVEQVRKLVEEEQVFLLAGTLGTPTNTAIHKYVNVKQIPHIFVNTGAAKWADPQNFPWTMGFNLSYLNEARIYAQYLLKNKPDARIAILYQNDDYGKDYVHGLKLGLGDKAESMIVAEASYEVTDPTIDSQIVSLKASGADTFFNVTTPKFAAQAIRRAYDIGWRPLHILNNVSSSVGSVLKPAGLEKSVGLITAIFLMDPIDPQWADTQAFKDYKVWFEKYYAEGSIEDGFNVNGYLIAKGVAHVLEQCGDDLTRANVMKQMASIKDLDMPMMLPGVKWNTSADDFSLIESGQLARFDGKEWKMFGEIVGN
jgi:branched-chain amino acid transport system substrate-binding protein